MRLLLLFLCLVNVVIAGSGWILHQRSSSGDTPQVIPDNRLMLLSELQAGSVRKRAAAADAPVAGVEQTLLTCELIGPFVTRRDAEKRRADLIALADLTVDQVVERPAIDYWVMIEPLTSLAEARVLAGKLNEKKLDTYVLSQGDYANGISLGLFSRPGRARRLEKRVRDAGFEPVLVQVERERLEYWLRVVWAQGMSSDSLRLSEVDAGGGSLRREPARCL